MMTHRGFAFIFGWMKVEEHENKPVMITWTGLVIVNFVVKLGAGVLIAGSN